LTTDAVTATEAMPLSAALRPRGPPATASATELPSQSFERSAARESRRNARSREGVGVAAIAA
jgi:hypothetical protein